MNEPRKRKRQKATKRGKKRKLKLSAPQAIICEGNVHCVPPPLCSDSLLALSADPEPSFLKYPSQWGSYSCVPPTPGFGKFILCSTTTCPTIETSHHWLCAQVRAALGALVATAIRETPAPTFSGSKDPKLLNTSLPLSMCSAKDISSAAQKAAKDYFMKWLFRCFRETAGCSFAPPALSALSSLVASVQTILDEAGVAASAEPVQRGISIFERKYKDLRVQWKRQLSNKVAQSERKGMFAEGDYVTVRTCAGKKGRSQQEQQVSLTFRKTTVKLNLDHYEKLKALFLYHQQQAPLDAQTQRQFDESVFCVTLRYQTMQAGGFQAAIPPALFDVLHRFLDVRFECFASPLNCWFPHYCSLFLDTDAVFGSLGSFFSFYPEQGSFEANPPFSEDTIVATIDHITSLLSKAQDSRLPLSFVVVVPHWNTADSWNSLVAHPFSASAPVHIPQREAMYCEGMQHIRGTRFRKATCDTSVFFLQTQAAMEKWPVTEHLHKSLRAAFGNPVRPTPAVPGIPRNKPSTKKKKRKGNKRNRRRKTKS